MKNYSLFAILFLLLFGCSEVKILEPTFPKKDEYILADFNEIRIVGSESNIQDSIINLRHKTNDTLIISTNLYNGVENLSLSVSKSNILEDFSINRELKLGYSQYTTDDNPAFDLGIDFNCFQSVQSVQSLMEKLDAEFDKIFKENATKIGGRSKHYQTKFYEFSLKNKEEYKEYGHEYISQAYDFLNEKSNLSTQKELAIEPLILEVTWHINYSIQGKWKTKFIHFIQDSRQEAFAYLTELDNL